MNNAATYTLRVRLINVNKELIDEFQFTHPIRSETQNKWLQISYVFKNYGPGLRFITFEHGGKLISNPNRDPDYEEVQMNWAHVSVQIPDIAYANINKLKKQESQKRKKFMWDFLSPFLRHKISYNLRKIKPV